MAQTIAAIATASAPGGIGVVRISGDDAKKIADKVFKSKSGKKLTDVAGYTAAFGHILEQNVPTYECVALVFNSPKSYTGEDVVEFSCYGGMYVIRAVLRIVLENGARMAEPGEFTRRAFENGKIGLTEAEAIMDIIGANGENAAKAAITAHSGALFNEINSIKDEIISVSSHLAAWADFPEEDIPEVEPTVLAEQLNAQRERIQKLIKSFDSGKLVRDGVNTAIVGKPNVGKSTLMNVLCGADTSIVTDISGTTRDVVTSRVMFKDICLTLSDTAGIHTAGDEVEKIGVERAKKVMQSCELILVMIDSSRDIDADDTELLEYCKDKQAVAIINKSDVDANKAKEVEDTVKQYVEKSVIISAKTNDGIDELYNAVKDVLSLSQFDPSQAMISNERQLDCAKRAEKSLTEGIESLSLGYTLDAVSVCLQWTMEALMELTGEKVTQEVSDGIFHNFCVGK
ncbi:MAG: tRNA uridine-5-carboxymethylaminomethyl(34) synthesis GTPase MnmE [Clostridia bacterium]|nr:tRNA uridine-5-carboxymethylaminomethyl(34) synthesis GTPase MnmE [Clostridia bacterium]